MPAKLFQSTFGVAPAAVDPISGSGSNRQYFRLTALDGRTLIGVRGTSVEENEAFIYLAAHLRDNGIVVPKVLAVSEDRLCYLQEDLGSRSLFDALRRGREAGGRYDDGEVALLERVMADLPRIQLLGARGLDFSRCYPQAELDRMGVLFDLNYFKYCFLKPSGVDFHEVRLERDFHEFAAMLLRPVPDAGDEALFSSFLYRDFQARNVMLTASDQPAYIDFQGGRRGPVHYDVASFLWQASARYSPDLRSHLIDIYLDNLCRLVPVDEEAFRSRLRLFVLFRLIQVLGAYGYRGHFERKQHFIDSIPPALANLRQLLPTVPLAESCPELARLLSALVAPPPLTVRVFSFSYKRGIPADESGNGGGYVFDCRSTNNPGRYAQYKQLTGLDAPVIRFLEEDGEILRFLDGIYPLADFHVERYIQRGFTDLMFSFGCTGGQHRSVYCAQHLAEHLHRKYGIRVSLCHREQGINQLLSD